MKTFLEFLKQKNFKPLMVEKIIPAPHKNKDGLPKRRINKE